MRPLHIPRVVSFPQSNNAADTLVEKPTAADAGAQITNQRCHLLQLPSELLTLIWEEVLICKAVLWVDPEGVPIDKIREDALRDSRRVQYLPSEPALSRTCRRIRRETLPIFYGRNTFCDTPVDLCCIKFLIYLTPEKRKMLRFLRIAHWKYYAETFLHINGGPPGTCITSARIRRERMMQWLQRGGLELPDDAIHFLMKRPGDGCSIWTNDLRGQCDALCAGCSSDGTPGQVALQLQ